jgi:hypothetical protein
MLLTLPLTPHLHGAAGWWDEIINLVPVIIGLVLIVYLYRNSRRRRDTEDVAAHETPAEHGPESTEAPEAPARH